ncbi:MAG: glycosyltransferase family 2 protein, partial [Chloroflexota bacterium]
LSATGGGTLASYYTGRNTILVLVKSVPGVILKKYAFQIIKTQYQIAYGAIRAWRGAEARARIRGQFVGLLSIPRWLIKRKPIQSSRQVTNHYLESLLQ